MMAWSVTMTTTWDFKPMKISNVTLKASVRKLIGHNP